MWLLGGLLGFGVGALMGGAGMGFLFALSSALVAHILAAEKGPGRAEWIALQRKFKELDERLREYERQARSLENKVNTINSTLAQERPAPTERAMTERAITEREIQRETETKAETHLKVHAQLDRELAPLASAQAFEPMPEPTTPHVVAPASAAALSPTSALTPAPAAAARSIPPSAATRPAPRNIKPPAPPAKSLRERLPAPIANFIFGDNTLVKVGVLILFLGLAFLLRYTAERVTVPIELRYAGVALSGVILLGLGWFLRQRRRDYALLLQGMAIGIFYLTTLSGIKFHALISPQMGFAFMLCIAILSAALAILQKAPALATVAALEGFVTPILTSTGENHPLGLFTYLSILDVSIALMAWFNAWRLLNVIAFVGTFTLTLGWADRYYSDDQYMLTQGFLIFFFVLFALIGIFFARRNLLDARATSISVDFFKQVGRVDSALVFGNPITAFGLQYMLVKHMELGASISALGISFFYVALAHICYSKEKQGYALLSEAYLIVAAIFATLAIPLGLDGHWTGAAWAVEGAGMYWLGIRQQRPYARGFAYLVMIGAAFKLLNSLWLNTTDGVPLIAGSALGPLLLSCSMLTIWHLHQRAKEQQVATWEQRPQQLLPWFGVAAFCLLPFMFVPNQTAAALLALIGAGLFFATRRWQTKILTPVARAVQATALIIFLLGLHGTNDTSQQAVLSDGWHGLINACIIAASILASITQHMRQCRREALEQGLQACWSLFNQIAVVSVCALLHLATLFALDFHQAATIWPLTACLTLWIALRMSHTTLAAAAIFIQVLSACVFILLPSYVPTASDMAYLHLGFLTPLCLGLAAYWSADRIRHEAKLAGLVRTSLSTDSANAGHKKPTVWLNPWCCESIALELPVLWAMVWLLYGLIMETHRVLTVQGLAGYFSSASIFIAIAFSCSTLYVARWRQWRELETSHFAYLPLLVFASLIGIASQAHEHYRPAQFLGSLFWPLALAWHFRSLFSLSHSETKPNWIRNSSSGRGGSGSRPFLLKLSHILGLWFFVLLAATQSKAYLQDLVFSIDNAGGLDPHHAWAWLGWIMVPALTLFAMSQPIFLKRWPMNEHSGTHRGEYLSTAAMPIAIYLVLWCWLGNIWSSGDASPLPYLPLLNPLELAQGLALIALLQWRFTLRSTAQYTWQKQINTFEKLGLAFTVLALLTGMVLRSCHHFGAVAWDFDTLFASRLSQAAVSVSWTCCAVLAMLLGHRRAQRAIWISGAILLAVVVLKLFLVELSGSGDMYRIISFIAVGILILLVGYFAPVPRQISDKTQEEIKP